MEGQQGPPSLDGDYFGLAHRNAVIGNDRRNLKAFIARTKHALLFTPKLTLTDHMVVNTPNLRLAYHTDASFRELLRPEWMRLAHFELNKDGSFKTLPELREFYFRAEHAFHPKLLHCFWDEQFDGELTAIQGAVPRQFPQASLRDPLFTEYATKVLESGILKPVLGELYSAYETAHALMREKYPVLGIIHFDPEHAFKGDYSVFHYMARLPSIRISHAQIVKLFGAEIAKVHRALLIKAEKDLLGVQTILPRDLINYGSMVFKSPLIDHGTKDKDIEIRKIPIELGALDNTTLAALTAAMISALRASEPGLHYFDVLSKIGSAKMSFDEICRAVSSYASHINTTLARASSVQNSAGFNSYLRVLRRSLSSEHGRAGGIATVVQIVGLVASSVFHFAPTIALGFVAKTADEQLRKRLTTPRLIDDVKAIVEVASDERLTQYQ